MTLPTVKTEFTDFGLGIVPPAGADTHAKIGVASVGPLTPQSLTRADQVAAIYGGGPLAGAMAVGLTEASPIIGVRVATDVPGVPSAVVKTGTGTSVATVTGSPVDAATISVRVTRAATGPTAGTAGVIVNVNGTDRAERALPVSGALLIDGTGLTLTFSAGTLAVGDVHSLTATAPSATLAAVVTALTDLLSTRPAIRFVHILGVATPALAAAVDFVLQERESVNYFVHGVIEARPMNAGETLSDYKAAIDTLFSAFASDRLALALDGGEVYNPITRSLEPRNSAWKATARRATQPVGDSAYRVRTGPLSAMGKLTFDANVLGTTGRYLALRTLDGRAGVYVANWPMLSVAGSDYDEVQARECADEAARIGYLSAQEFLGEDLPVDLTTGFILEPTAQAFEAYVAGRIQAALTDNVSGIRITVDRGVNILSTKSFAFTVGIIPKGYARQITVRVGFINPALLVQTLAAPTAAPAGA
ncbi:hypothetical protein E7T06_07295 [Deinococcus sp. Arct2-2]|uniref:DUF2586 family protein n=1 Tax=Deinococcus sp. Arct2-2 TaxID=2568653 RepID=UPI0010A45C38|nr:DUF2586 family protein [Deinococcus sp. Arct2-2]THF70502.1 hypothetical protein E7T06_07295 [Deinococcus sp. Arct2-2]